MKWARRGDDDPLDDRERFCERWTAALCGDAEARDDVVAYVQRTGRRYLETRRGKFRLQGLDIEDVLQHAALVATDDMEKRKPCWESPATYAYFRTLRGIRDGRDRTLRAEREADYVRTRGLLEASEIEPGQSEETCRVLRECTRRLESRVRRLLLERYLRGLSLREIGDAAGRSHTAVRNAIAAAIPVLHRCLAEKGVVS